MFAPVCSSPTDSTRSPPPRSPKKLHTPHFIHHPYPPEPISQHSSPPPSISQNPFSLSLSTRACTPYNPSIHRTANFLSSHIFTTALRRAAFASTIITRGRGVSQPLHRAPRMQKKETADNETRDHSPIIRKWSATPRASESRISPGVL